MSYFNRYLLGGFVQASGQNCTTTSDIFGDGSDLALYRFQGNATDDSGNNNNGTATDVGFTLTNGAQPASGARFGGSAAFNGSSSYIDVSSLTSLFGGKNTNTVSLWFKTTTTGYVSLFGTHADTSINNTIDFNNGNIEVYHRYSGATTTLVTTSGTLNDGNWHNVVSVVDTGTLIATLYVDGVIVGTPLSISANPWNGVATQRVIIGSLYYPPISGFQNYFPGEIDQVRIFNRAVNATQAVTLFEDYLCQPGSTAAFSQCTTDTVGYPVNAAGATGDGNTMAFYKMDDAAGSATLADSTTNAYNATVNGGVTFGNQGIYGPSALLDGTTGYFDVGAALTAAIRATPTAFSYSIWIKTSSTATQHLLTDADITGAPFFGLNTGITSNVLYSETKATTGGTTFTELANTSVTDGQWHHCVWTFGAGSVVSIYVDGILDMTPTAVSTFNNTGRNFLLGIRYGTPNLPFNGQMDHFKAFDVELTAAQVKQLYEEVYCDTGCTTSTVDYQTTATALYRLDGDGNDDSTNAYNGTPTDVTFEQGKYDLAAVFNGSTSNIIVEDSATNAFGFPTHTGTISAWVNINSLASENPIIAKRDTGNPGNRSWTLDILSTGTFSITIYNTNTNDEQAISTTTLSTNQWYHVAVTFTTTSIVLYIDGTPDTTQPSTYTTIQNSGADLQIGRRGTNGGYNYFDGSIDQVRIYPTALTAGEITNLYNEVSCS